MPWSYHTSRTDPHFTFPYTTSSYDTTSHYTKIPLSPNNTLISFLKISHRSLASERGTSWSTCILSLRKIASEWWHSPTKATLFLSGDFLWIYIYTILESVNKFALGTTFSSKRPIKKRNLLKSGLDLKWSVNELRDFFPRAAANHHVVFQLMKFVSVPSSRTKPTVNGYCRIIQEQRRNAECCDNTYSCCSKRRQNVTFHSRDKAVTSHWCGLRQLIMLILSFCSMPSIAWRGLLYPYTFCVDLATQHIGHYVCEWDIISFVLSK